MRAHTLGRYGTAARDSDLKMVMSASITFMCCVAIAGSRSTRMSALMATVG